MKQYLKCLNEMSALGHAGAVDACALENTICSALWRRWFGLVLDWGLRFCLGTLALPFERLRADVHLNARVSARLWDPTFSSENVSGE